MDKSYEGNAKHFFLSYSWNDSELANSIDDELQSLGFDVKRDIRDIGSWKSIKAFMASIRNQDYAIIIISPSYLKSPNCMYEVAELFKDARYKDKIFSIVTSDADIYNPVSRAVYIKYWEEESKKLEESLRPLKIENIPELAMTLRQYKSIEATIASFLDLIVDKNNPQVIDAINEIKEIILTEKLDHDVNVGEQRENCIEIKIEAYHYAFLKFAALVDCSGTPMERAVGIKKLDDNQEPDAYDLPALCCEVINQSAFARTIYEPFIEGSIELNAGVFDGISFSLIPNEEKRLEPGAKARFWLQGLIMVDIIRALFEGKIKSVSVRDNFGFRYYVPTEQIEKAGAYFKKYCPDLEQLKAQHNMYCLE